MKRMVQQGHFVVSQLMEVSRDLLPTNRPVQRTLETVKNHVGTPAASSNRAAEDQPRGIQEEKNSFGSEAASFKRVAEYQPQGVRSDVHKTFSPILLMEGCRPDGCSDGASDSASQSLLERGVEKVRGFLG